MKIAFIYFPGRLSRLAKVKAGQGASEFFYGSVQLLEWGDEVEIFELKDKTKVSFGKIVGDYLYKWNLLPDSANGSMIMNIKELCPYFKKFDVVVGTSPGISFALSLCRTLRLFDQPIVGFYCGQADYIPTWLRRKMNSYFLRRTWAQLYSETEFDVLSKTLNVPHERLIINQFGVDLNFWTPGNDPEGDYVLSVGNDSRRDYDLLAKVASKINYPFIIVTKLPIKETIPPNMKIISGKWDLAELSDGELRDLYRRAKCVVIPLKESLQAAGQSVCLQAMACGKPVILTRTRGIWSRSMMRDGENIIIVMPGDEDALGQKIKHIMSNPSERERIGQNARLTACNEADIRSFAHRLRQTCKMALENKKGWG